MVTLQWWHKIAVGICPFSGEWYPISLIRTFVLGISAADWLLRNTTEGALVCTITTLSEAFGVEGFTISITWSWILKQWREFNKGNAMAFLVDEWVTPGFGNRYQRKIDMPLWITNATELLSRKALCQWSCQCLIANMKKQKDRHYILPMLANMATRLWRFVQMTQVFL